MNCQEALSLLYDVIDKEASEIDVQQVQEHLHKCKDCAGVYNLERTINDLIKERLKSEEPTPQLDSLKSRVLTQLDDIDMQGERAQPIDNVTPTSNLPSFRLGRALAIAASVVIAIGAVFYGGQIFDDHQAMLPLEEAHWAAEADVDRYRDDNATTLARARIQEHYSYDLEDRFSSYALVGGQVTEVSGEQVVHFVYHNDNKIVSVFVLDAGKVEIPDSLAENTISVNGVEFLDHNCRGCRLVYHRIGDAMVITATTERDIDLLHFVPDRDPV